MKIINDIYHYIHEKPSIVVLGTFDGVHAGHKQLLNKAVYISKKENLDIIVVSFANHPGLLFSKNIELVTTNQEKQQLLMECGVDILISQTFDHNFANLNYEDFLQLIISKLNPTNIIVGYDYTFGYKALGNTKALQCILNSSSINLHIVQEYTYNGEKISSTYLRQVIKDCDFETFKELCNREYTIEGIVVHGQGIGKQIGFPTMNIDLPANKAIPPFGIYACMCEVDGHMYDSVVNLGSRPTVNKHIPILEAYVMNFNEDVYGKKIKIIFKKHLRNIAKFENLEQLTKAIANDKLNAQNYFKTLV